MKIQENLNNTRNDIPMIKHSWYPTILATKETGLEIKEILNSEESNIINYEKLNKVWKHSHT